LAQGLSTAEPQILFDMEFEVNFGLLGAFGALLALVVAGTITIITLFTCGCQCAYRTPTSPKEVRVSPVA